jgi:glycine cleavage system H protein
MNVPEDLQYTAEHEWVAVLPDGRVKVGITDFAQDALGDIVYVDLPEQGKEVSKGDLVAEIESTKSIGEVYAPFDGTVVDVNEALGDAPDLINADPYGAAWLFIMEAAEGAELTDLLDAAGYREQTE